MVAQAQATHQRAIARDRVKNPMMPDNYLDFSECGFPSDIHVVGIQIPRPGIPGEMMQYRDAVNLQWIHVPWDFISQNAGADGKAYVPGATRYELGGGHFVAVVANHYLMFASRQFYEERRARNISKAGESLQYKLDHQEEVSRESGYPGTLRAENAQSGPMSLDDLLDYEKRIGDEAPLQGVKITR